MAKHPFQERRFFRGSESKYGSHSYGGSMQSGTHLFRSRTDWRLVSIILSVIVVALVCIILFKPFGF